ncbi:MAG TPA: SNF2-related protein, partial [Candidatus Polarisedimenticolaceae bacterium]|nr:SNF2-related protein [Candidatus Polarisedimenticolaceae bacterium]
MEWSPGDRLVHRFNPELGPGVVRETDGRTVVVEFPETGTTLRLACDSDALGRLSIRPGIRARLEPSGETVVIEELREPNSALLEDGRLVKTAQLWPLVTGESLPERLAAGQVDPLDAFALRLDLLHLAAIREADGLGSFLGGRIHLFPHQLYVAERATRSDPVRWLLADEVGLGKTVEACLILNHLVRTRRAERTLVVAPETLTVQWLGELWRKYHQVFVLLDDKRLHDVERDYGRGFNPFDAHRSVVVGLERLRGNPWLTERAVEAGIDLLVVDEAHHLRRPPGHPGDASYRAIAPIAALGRHVLLLTATPLEEDAHGFFRLLQLLRPDEFHAEESFDERLRAGRVLPACTSATRRGDIG